MRTAFDDADEDGGGAVDLDEFTKLYAKVKKGQVKYLHLNLYNTEDIFIYYQILAR